MRSTPSDAVTSRVLYLLPRFPSITETFLFDEIVALDGAGIEVLPLAVIRMRVRVSQPRVRELAPRIRYVSPVRTAAALAIALLQHPRLCQRVIRQGWRDRPRRSWRARYKHWAALSLAPGVAQLARSLGADHLHAAYLGHPATTIMAAAELAGLPFSAAAHAHDIFKESAGLARKLRRAAFVRVISRYNQRLLHRLAPELSLARLPLIPCGLTADWLLPPPRFPTPLPPRAQGMPHHLLAVAQLRPYKALDVLLEAVAILLYRGFDLRLSIIGDGTAAADLRSRAESLGLDPPLLRWLGARSSTEVRAALEESDILVAPARRERSGKQDGVPLILAEAMARGVPVIATRLSGIPELVQHRRNGWLVPPEDPGALALAIAALLDAPLLRRRLARAGRATVVLARRLDQSAACLAECFRRAGRGGSAGNGAMRTSGGSAPWSLRPPPEHHLTARAHEAASPPDNAEGGDRGGPEKTGGDLPKAFPCAPLPPPLPRLLPAPSGDALGTRGGASRRGLSSRPCRAADLPAILDLFALAFGPHEAEQRSRRWHWFATFGSPAFVIEKRGTLLGCLSTLSVPLWVGDREVSCRWIGATAVHPEHRGVAGALAAVVREHEWLASGFPLPRMEALWRRVDHHGNLQRPRRLRLWVRPLWGGRRRRERCASLRPWEQQGWPSPEDLHQGGSHWQVVVRPRLGAEWAGWLHHATRSWPITLSRSTALCNRLFAEDPVGPHAFVLLYRQGAPVAYAAVDFYTDYRGQMQAGLGDCFAHRGDLMALGAVIRAAVRFARRSGAQNLKALEPTDGEGRRLFRRIGFWPGRAPGHALLLAHTPHHISPAWYGDLGNWHLPRIWADPRRF
jgi:glycosyltransferase involved in cell wall biosynthesis